MNGEDKVGFIGAGSMGEALVKAVLEAELFNPENILVSDIKKERRQELKSSYGVETTTNNGELVSKVDYLILAIKPKMVNKVLTQVGSLINEDQILFSIAAGVSIKQLENNLANEVAVARLMPNTPALIGEGALAYTLGKAAGEEAKKLVEDLFTPAGIVVQVEEELMDAVTGLSGSGPAYIYVLIEAMADAGVYEGLAREKAVKLAAQTVKGAAEMVIKRVEHPAKLKDMVTSPGGTTITGLKKLEEAGFRAAIYKAIGAAADKSRQLGGE